MANCPKCKAEMGEREAVCPKCGYDFPPTPDASLTREGIAYSPWADIALMVGAVVAAIACVGCAIGALYTLFHGEFWAALVTLPVQFFLSLAMLVVFLRIQKV